MAILITRAGNGSPIRQNHAIRGSGLSIEVDAFLSEKHTMTNTVPKMPVEDGYPVTDHIIKNPTVVTYTGKISTAPLFTTSDMSPQRADSSYQKLKSLRNSGAIVQVTSGLTTYKGMAITNLSIPRNSKIGEALEFDITFTEVRVASTDTLSREEVASWARTQLTGFGEAWYAKRKPIAEMIGDVNNMAQKTRFARIVKHNKIATAVSPALYFAEVTGVHNITGSLNDVVSPKDEAMRNYQTALGQQKIADYNAEIAPTPESLGAQKVARETTANTKSHLDASHPGQSKVVEKAVSEGAQPGQWPQSEAQKAAEQARDISTVDGVTYTDINRANARIYGE